MVRCRVLLPLLALLCFLVSGDAASIPRHRRSSTQTCGYQSCPVVDSKKLNIHLVAHTHDDVGWLKTVDQYYFGSHGRTQKAGVQYILDSVVQALLADPSRKFIYVETAFFWKWWLRQNDQVREDVRNLINEGRLEMIGGAWSMNDEATTHYHSLVDQFTWGFRRLNDTFGSCARPRIGWQIDPFGHSREQASLFAQMGFDGMLFGRIDYQDKGVRLEGKNMEFVWKASPNLGKKADLFTAAMYNTYSPPPGFCFDVLCDDEPIIDDPESPDYNVDARVGAFLKYAAEQAKYYRTNNLIMTMGGDFTYQYAEMYFKNLDKLIRYTTELKGTEVNIFYSTPSCYLKALHEQNLQWPTKSDDFFPYASDPHAFWTGYFTSRPTVKFFERMGNNLLQISKQVAAMTNLEKYDAELEHFREAMGVMQHHDAVTGTEKQLVAEDYSRILAKSMNDGEKILADGIMKMSTKEKSEEEKEDAVQAMPKMFSCTQLNITSCPYTEDSKSFVLTIYNPLSRSTVSPIRVPVQGTSYTVATFKDGVEVLSQIVPIPEHVQKIPGRQSKATNELVFMANIPAMGYAIYVVTEKEGRTAPTPADASGLKTAKFEIAVTPDGKVNVLVVADNQKKVLNYEQSFHFYEGAEGDNRVFENRSSGAYIFRPTTRDSFAVPFNGQHKVFKGPVVQELHHYYNDWLSQVVRLYSGADFVEFEWLVGPIPIEDKVGKEIITKYSSNLNTKGEFYTDSNGREMLKRTKDFRPTWNLTLHEPVAGNYYPITSKIALKDAADNMRLSVLVDRAQGGTSLKDGEIEVMLHRRLLRDDAFGVGEALNETAFGTGLVARGTHYLFGGEVTDPDKHALKEKNLALELSLRPWTLFAPLTNVDNVDEWRAALSSKVAGAKSGLAKTLPLNVHVLTLEPWKDGTVLLRLEHFIEYDEAVQLSQPAEVNIKDLFSTFDILSIAETTLGGNQWLEDMNRFKWQSESNDVHQQESTERHPIRVNDDAINVFLEPMEIRTFILKVSPRKL